MTKAKRLKVQARWEELPKYYNRDIETTSQAGKVYYNLNISTLAKPKSTRPEIIGGEEYFTFIKNTLGI